MDVSYFEDSKTSFKTNGNTGESIRSEEIRVKPFLKAVLSAEKRTCQALFEHSGVKSGLGRKVLE